MESLRRKTTDDTAARPRQRLPGASGSSGGGARLRSEPKDLRKSRVGDKIKKRMSMRYADISEPMNIPDVPSIPGRALRPIQRDDLIVEEEDILDYDDVAAANDAHAGKRVAVTIDKEAMQQSGFDPEAYLRTKISASSETEVKMLESSLENAKAEASADLQRSVFQNYEEFVLISKEISTLENDMLELKEGLAEWKNMPALLSIEDSTSAAADRRRANRSSVADLTKLYATQITTLHSNIEGSAKFVPPLAGRHVVTEVENMWSLNAATYKVEYAVHFVLLDDALLVAKRRKRRTGEGGKLVAERCWQLGEINVVDVKDSLDVTRAFRIRRGRENFVYRCEKNADKKSFLSTFKATAEEYSARRRKEREGEHERRRSMWNAEDRMSMVGDVPIVPSLSTISSNGTAPGGAHLKEEQDAKWIVDFTDDLTVAISLRNWSAAVDLVMQGKQRVGVMPTLGPKLSTLSASLVSSLLHALSDSTLRKSGVVALTSHLIQLGYANAARDAFLHARGELVRKRARMIAFEGEIAHYITELAIVIFTCIKHTAEWYLASFKENDMASGFIQWATEQLDLFSTLFKRQLDGQTDPEDIQESLSAMHAQSKRLLRDNNLDFSYLLDDLLADTEKLLLTMPASTKTGQGTISSALPAFNRPPRGGLSPIAVPAPSGVSAFGPITPTSAGPSRTVTPKPVPPLSPSRSASRPQTPKASHSPVPNAPPPRSRDRPLQ